MWADGGKMSMSGRGVRLMGQVLLGAPFMVLSLYSHQPHPTPPHHPPQQKQKMPHVAIEGVLTRRKCAGKWCATFWAPRAPDLVALNSQIFILYDLGNFGYM